MRSTARGRTPSSGLAVVLWTVILCGGCSPDGGGNGLTQPRLTYSDSGCLPSDTVDADAQDYPGCGEDALTVTAGSYMVEIVHTSATYDCAAKLSVEMEADGQVLRFNEVYVDGMVDCLCCYDAHSIVEFLSAGTYTIEYCGLQGPEPCQSQEVTLEVQG